MVNFSPSVLENENETEIDTYCEEEIEFIVVENLSVPILIGWPSIQKLDAKISAQNRTIEIRDEVRLRINAASEWNWIHTLEDQTIEPRSVKTVREEDCH
jgi:hypothetical protein